MKVTQAFGKLPLAPCSVRLGCVNACILRSSQLLLRFCPRTSPSWTRESPASQVIYVNEELSAVCPYTDLQLQSGRTLATFVQEHERWQRFTKRSIQSEYVSSTRCRFTWL